MNMQRVSVDQGQVEQLCSALWVSLVGVCSVSTDTRDDQRDVMEHAWFI
jgi:hypothetical protein